MAGRRIGRGWGLMRRSGWTGSEQRSAGGEDLELGRARQAALDAADARAGLTWRPLVADGVCGPASIAAMRRHGYSRWRDVGCAERAA
jgi:hypothetical protein